MHIKSITWNLAHWDYSINVAVIIAKIGENPIKGGGQERQIGLWWGNVAIFYTQEQLCLWGA